MLANTRNIDLVKALHLKKVGLAFASLWVIVLVAAVAATIYREFDGPTVRTVMAQNVDLSTVNISLNTNLDAVQIENAQLNSNLLDSRAKLVALKKQFESYIASFAPIENASKIPLSIGIRSFP
jgi:hypothetical protein